MPKIKKLHLVAAIFLAVVFTAGSIGVAILASRLGATIEASVINSDRKRSGPVAFTNQARPQGRSIYKKRLRGSALHRLLAQANDAQIIYADICSYLPPEKPEYKGEFVNRDVRSDAQEGGEFMVTLYLKNTGNVPWFGSSSGCFGQPVLKLGTARERDRASIFYNPGDQMWLEPTRIAMLEKRVEPGDMATFHFISRAPTVTDIFREYFQPVVEGIQWIDTRETTVKADVYVGEDATEFEQAALYLGKSGQASQIDPSGELVIDIDITDQKMRVKLGDQQIREFQISSGTFNTPTPIGRFKIINKEELRIGRKWPHYHMPKWQAFTDRGHGLHSLPYLANDKGIFWEEALNHIGRPVSHGCVRVLPDDAADLFNITKIGDPIIIHY